MRWEFYGLPGLGKTTLSRAVSQHLKSQGRETLVLPEAVPYAVKVRGIRLLDLEPFLDEVNFQAEMLAQSAASVFDQLVIVRDPAHQQNESYRFVLHALRDSKDPAAHCVRLLAAEAAIGSWNAVVAHDLGRILWDRHEALRFPPAGPWQVGHVLLTTGDPMLDVALSLTRQHRDGRDNGLITGDPGILGAYLSTLLYAEAETRRRTGARMVQLDPQLSIDVGVKAMDSALIAFERPVDSKRP